MPQLAFHVTYGRSAELALDTMPVLLLHPCKLPDNQLQLHEQALTASSCFDCCSACRSSAACASFCCSCFCFDSYRAASASAALAASASLAASAAALRSTSSAICMCIAVDILRQCLVLQVSQTQVIDRWQLASLALRQCRLSPDTTLCSPESHRMLMPPQAGQLTCPSCSSVRCLLPVSAAICACCIDNQTQVRKCESCVHRDESRVSKQGQQGPWLLNTISLGQDCRL